MANQQAGNLTNELLRRLRDPDATGLQRAFVRRVLSDTQRLVNAHTRKHKVTTTFTVAPNQAFYKIQENFPDAIRIEYVREGVRDVRKTTIRALQQIDHGWFRRVGPSFKHFALVGRDLFVLYPTRNVEAQIEVVYTKLTTAFDDDTVEAEITDDDMIQASDLAEIILLVKTRHIELVEPVLARFSSRMGVLHDEQK